MDTSEAYDEYTDDSIPQHIAKSCVHSQRSKRSELAPSEDEYRPAPTTGKHPEAPLRSPGTDLPVGAYEATSSPVRAS